MSKKLVWGVGLYERGEYTAKVGGKMTKEYTLWKSVLERCYSENWRTRYSTYIGCSVSEEFSDFQKFSKWCNTQIGFGVCGYQLDKDIIHKGNKQYSRDGCAFVPREVNILLTTSKATRGVCPIGVDLHVPTGKFRVRCGFGEGGQKHVGLFPNREEAFSAYKEAKEAYIKVVAEKYKDSIDPRVYQALMEWEVNIDD